MFENPELIKTKEKREEKINPFSVRDLSLMNTLSSNSEYNTILTLSFLFTVHWLNLVDLC